MPDLLTSQGHGFAWTRRGTDLAGWWELLDLTGDGRPDLVYSSDPDTPYRPFGRDAGNDHWLVFANQGCRFANTATTWPLPHLTSATNGDGIGAPFFINSSYGAWMTVDMDGDALPDLVFPSDLLTGPVPLGHATGNPHWTVYHNTGAGFDPQGVTWAVPDLGLPNGGIYALTANNNSIGAWDTLDMNGDGRPDLVITSARVGNGIEVLGRSTSPHWDVYTNTGMGFSATAVAWNLPSRVGTNADYGVTRAAGAGLGAWDTVDLDGDGLKDLVLTGLNRFTTLEVVGHANGNDVWWYYKNTGAAFDLGQRTWEVPDAGGSEQFAWTRAVGLSHAYLAGDFTGDGIADFLHIAAPGELPVGPVAGMDHWLLYEGGTGGFSSSPRSWAVPAVAGTRGYSVAEFEDAGDSVTPPTGRGYWATVDLNGDGFVDLAQTSERDTNQRVFGMGTGSAHWNVYLAQ